MQAWLKKRPESEASILRELFEKSFEETYRYTVESLVMKMDVLEHNLIVQVGKSAPYWKGQLTFYVYMREKPLLVSRIYDMMSVWLVI